MDVRWQCPKHRVPAISVTGSDVRFACGCSVQSRDGVYDFVGTGSYADAFGFQWMHWSQTQLDSHTGTRISRIRLEEALGPDVVQRMRGLRVLEVGCGAGRFTEVLLEMGAQVASVDLSEAAFVNAKNCPPSHAHVVARADVGRLPLEPEQFDVVLALGMVQHTRSSQDTIAAIWRMVAPGGTLILDHYPLNLRYMLQAKPIYRQVLKRQPPHRAIEISNKLYDFWAPLHRRYAGAYRRRVLTRLSPIVFVTDEFPELTEAHMEAWGRLDTFDSLTDWYKHRITRRRLERILERLQPSELTVEGGGNGWLARANRSAQT